MNKLIFEEKNKALKKFSMENGYKYEIIFDNQIDKKYWNLAKGIYNANKIEE